MPEAGAFWPEPRACRAQIFPSYNYSVGFILAWALTWTLKLRALLEMTDLETFLEAVCTQYSTLFYLDSCKGIGDDGAGREGQLYPFSQASPWHCP